MRLQPITYSLIFNLLAFLVCAYLAWDMDNVLLAVLPLLIAQHSMARFRDDENELDDPDDDEAEPAIGFTADIR